MQSIEKLINKYLEKANACASAMNAYCDGIHPIRAYRERKISAKGDIEKPVQLKYSIHGVGCHFSFNDCEVDVDFDLNGECAGFDAWRLWLYAKSLSIEAQWPLQRIEMEMSKLLKLGTIQPVTDLPCGHLFKLVVSA